VASGRVVDDDVAMANDRWRDAPSPLRELPFLWFAGLLLSLVCGRQAPGAMTATRFAVGGDGGLGILLGLSLALNARGAADFMAFRATRRPSLSSMSSPSSTTRALGGGSEWSLPL
jgi:hypothetical protein